MLSPGRDFPGASLAWNKKRHKFYGQRMEHMVESLRDKLEQLSSKKRRIEMRLKAEESAYKKRTNKVMDWLYKADTVGAEADRVITEAEGELAERRTVGCYPWNRRPTGILRLNVYEKLKVVCQLLTADDYDVVVQRTPHRHVDVIPVEPTVDFESNLDDVWRCLEDERLQVIGIFGMAGVGKTTLLKKIRDGIQKERMDVIWLSASKKTRAMEKDMAKQLAVLRNANKRASDGDRNFMLLIDDLWARLDLSKIVAPHLNGSGYKVVFTTRSEAVCDGMAADAKLKLNCLSDDEAMKLFWMTVGDGIRDSFPQAQQLANHVNESLCQGLPLALIAVGRAMAGMKNPSFEELSGMKHVFHVLQPSYDNLDDDMVRRLFLYCSILPVKIRKGELIRLWIGEGFVESSDDQRGEYFIKKLEQACLLEIDELSDYVGMHRVIRAFGLYICRELVEADNNFLVIEWKSENLSEAVRISLDSEIDIATLQWSCPKLRSLFIRNSNMTMFPADLFQSMHCLEVLNLSNNDKLAELPTSIGILTNLHYLSLSFTSIKDLPAEVKLLKTLKVLLADYTENLKMIPVGVIPSISSLKVFSKLGNKIYDDIMLLEELKSSKAIDGIGVSLFTHQAVEKLVDSQKLQHCIRELTLKNIKSLKIPVSFLAKMAQLENFVIDDCTDLQFEMDESCYHVLSIQGLWVQNCSEIDNLRWLIFAPGLKVLDLRSCESLVEVIGSDFEPGEIAEIDERLGIFSNLNWMHLEDLYSLQFICPQVLRFPALRDVYIVNCPQLSLLPFDANDVLRKNGGRCLQFVNNACKVPDLNHRRRDRDEVQMEEVNQSNVDPELVIIDRLANEEKGGRVEAKETSNASAGLDLVVLDRPANSARSHQQASPSHVFLSFRGADTRKNFIDHLFKALTQQGIDTYHDEDAIEQGENIETEIFKALRESRLSIVVLSENYASSKRCLDELVLIMERRKLVGHVVVPVFYNVDHFQVRYQTGPYAEAFALHCKIFEKEIGRVDQWRTALREVADLGGIVLQDGYKSELVENLVREVDNKLSRMVLNVAPHLVGVLNVAPHLVGIDSYISRMNRWIREESDHVEIAAIYGIGGIGKTAIAKTLYNMNLNKFDARIFLSNIKETSEQLLSDLVGGMTSNLSNVDEGIIRIQDALRGKKVLLIADDVDDLAQYNSIVGIRRWFDPGSKIIITTRREHLLKFHEFSRRFEVEKLDAKESLELFCWHAFAQKHPAHSSYEEHSKKIVQHCSGIPLALIVLGSSLSGKSLSQWESALEKLDNFDDSRIQQARRISFDFLQDDHDEGLFLDDFRVQDAWGYHATNGILNSDNPGIYVRLSLWLSTSMTLQLQRRWAKATNFSYASLPQFLVLLSLAECGLSDNAIPADISGLSSLEHLDLSGNPFHCLPESINSLAKLYSLKLRGCVNLQRLPELPTNLTFLDARGCTSLKDIPNRLKSLKELSISTRSGKTFPVSKSKSIKDVMD